MGNKRNSTTAPAAPAEETKVAETVNAEGEVLQPENGVAEGALATPAEGESVVTENTSEESAAADSEQEPAPEAEQESSEPAPQASEEGSAVETVVQPAADAESFKHDPYAGMSVIARTLLGMVDKHIETLDPKRPINVDAGIASQRSFQTTLVNIFSVKDAKDFVAIMDTLLAKIREHGDGAFNEMHAYRHWANLPMAKDRLKAFEYNLSALLTLAKTANRKEAFSSVDFKLAFSNLKEAEVTRLVAYFKRYCGV